MAIGSFDEHEEWLKNQPRETCILHASRSALRSFLTIANPHECNDATDVVSLMAARAILITGVAAKFSSIEFSKQASRAHSALKITGEKAAKYRNTEANFALTATGVAVFSVVEEATNWAASHAAEAAYAADYTNSRARKLAFAETQIPDSDLYRTPLFGIASPISNFGRDDSHLYINPEWSFWREWYQGFLDGMPLDWELQRRVALIDNVIWEAGPEAVAKEIGRIVARYDVETALNDLAAEKDVVQNSRLGIGGNNPPEAIEDAPALERHIKLIWNGVDTLAEEVNAEVPDKTRVEAALGMLKTGLAACLKWCARKGDLAVDTLIKWGVPVGGSGYLALNPDKVRALIEAVETWLPFL